MLSTTTYNEKNGEGTFHIQRRCYLPHFALYVVFFNTTGQSEHRMQHPGCGASKSQEGCDSLCGKVQETESQATAWVTELSNVRPRGRKQNTKVRRQNHRYDLEEARHKS